MKLVIIAAGQGTRLRSVSNEINKTLLPVFGRRLIDILLDNAVQCGLNDVVIVTGYQNQTLEQALKDNLHSLNLEFIYNPDWRANNGISILAAKRAIPEGSEFLVSMSDHLYGAGLLRKIINCALNSTIASVGLDFRIDQIFDLQDGMKVRVIKDESDQLITAMGKKLENFDAIDCGVFKCGYEFFRFLEQAQVELNGSLADACNLLIQNKQMGGVDIRDEFWLDIDTPAAYRFCTENHSIPAKLNIENRKVDLTN